MRPYTIVDVFTEVPLEGNPVAAFTDALGLADTTMQRAARELNLSETVFVMSPDDGADARVRIFTPGTELPFAGHPVLGTAFVLGTQRRAEMIRLQTAAGVIPVWLRWNDDRVVFGEMEQPVPTPETFGQVDDLLAALGVQRSELPVEVYRNGPRHVFVTLDSEQAVSAIVPDMPALAALGELGINCIAGQGNLFKTRNFSPGLGVSEDPATGSAAGPLALHLARHGRIEFGQQIEIRQGAEISRPSVLQARVEGSPERVQRVVVGGAAVIVARGEYRLQ